jgi:hypothetical protein
MTAGRELAFPRPPVNYEAYEATRAYMYITGDMCNADRRERVRRWNLSGSILDARPNHFTLFQLSFFSGLGCYRALDKRGGGDGQQTRVLPVPGKRGDEE